MSNRDSILVKIRNQIHSSDTPETRRKAVQERIDNAQAGIIPKRSQLPHDEQIEQFCQNALANQATVTRLDNLKDVPKAVSDYLREKNIQQAIRMGHDPFLQELPWSNQPSLELKQGASDGFDEAGMSHASTAISETGTLMMMSGTDNPTTINFLPDYHIVVVEEKDITGDMETALARLRKTYGKHKMPRAVNFITGPSRSGDIEQKLILGAHGPRALHLIVVKS